MYGPEDLARQLDVSRETLARLETYASLLKKWQRAKNLVANSTIDDMWQRHFLDSAQMVPHLQEAFGDRKITMLDIGSGAGFPALVLAAMGVGQAHMVESNGRKCTFMNQVSRETGADASIHNSRIEDLDVFPVDIVTSRACARIIQLLEWAAPFLLAGTEMWLLKGEGADEELTEAQASWKMTVNRFKSLSDPSGVILRLSSLKRL